MAKATIPSAEISPAILATTSDPVRLVARTSFQERLADYRAMKRQPICVGKRSDLDEAGYFCKKLPDGKELLILTAAGALYAIQRRCPHEAAPLERGHVWDGMIRCGQHAFTFDLETGEGLNCPGYRIESYAVEERNGSLFVCLDNGRDPGK